MVFIESYNSVGGGQRTIKRMVQAACSVGIADVVLILTAPTKEIREFYDDSGATILELETKRINSFGNAAGWLRLTKVFTAAYWVFLYSWRLKNMLRVIKGPVVCCDYRAYLLTIITSILAVQKVYLYLVGGIPLTRSAVKTLNRFASEVYFISKELGNECGDMSPRVLINGIDTSKLRQVEIFKENALNFVFVGTLVQQKGLHVIITALQNLESSNWRLDVIGDYLVGDENYKEYIEYLTKDDNRINFLGKVDDVFDRLSSYTALMFGSQKSNTINWKGNKYIVESSEGSPTVIIEAALSGIPVFASISTGVRELSLELPNVTIVDWDSFHYEIIEASLKARVNVSEATIDLFDYTKIYKEYLNDINESV